MAYNNGFPVGYQQYYPAYQTLQGAQMPSTNGGIIWVQGEAGAKSYLVAPNTTVQLWDSERQTIYLKSADASGMPSMKTLDYTIRENAPTSVPVASSRSTNNSPAYATKDDVDALYGQIAALRAEMDGLTAKKTAPKPKREVTDDE